MSLNKSKKLLVLGAGWFGSALCRHFASFSWEVFASIRSDAERTELEAQGIVVRNYTLGQKFPFSLLSDVDTVVIAIPPGKDDGVVDAHKELVRSIDDLQPKRVILISSTGVYGSGAEVEVDEYSAVKDGKLKDIELVYQLGKSNLSIIRFGGLIGPDRYPGRFFSGRKDIPNGRASVNLIHLDDCIGLTEAVMRTGYSGIVNGVMPIHYSRAEFYTKAAELAGMELPEFKDELVSEKRVCSKVIGSKLDFQFKHNDPMEALQKKAGGERG